jgi:hypothetical protein
MLVNQNGLDVGFDVNFFVCKFVRLDNFIFCTRPYLADFSRLIVSN